MDDETSQTSVADRGDGTPLGDIDDDGFLGKRKSVQSAIELSGSRKASIVDNGGGPEKYDDEAKGFSEEVIDEASDEEDDLQPDDGGSVIGALGSLNTEYAKDVIDGQVVYVAVCSDCHQPATEAFGNDDWERWRDLRQASKWGLGGCSCAESYGAVGDGQLEMEGVYKADELDRLLSEDEDLRNKFLEYLGDLAVVQNGYGSK